MALAESLNGTATAGFCPVTLQTFNELNARISADTLYETAVTFNGGRRSFESHKLNNITMIVELSGHIVTHLTSNFHVVSPDKCRIFTVSLAVEEDNRNAFLHSFVDNRRNGMGLIGRDNQQIDTVFYELFYLLDLSFIVIVGQK